MRIAVLGSGSRGNAVVVEAAGERLLLDAGFSCRQLEKRMAKVGVDPSTVRGVVMTHEHGDHIRGADVFCRRWGAQVYATAGTLTSEALGEQVRGEAVPMVSGSRYEVGAFEIEPFAIPHDAVEPIGFVVTAADGCRVGLVADLGTRSQLAWGRLTDLDILLLETNHDLSMLRNGPYPWATKQRIAGRYGHLSNREAAEGLRELVCDRLRWVGLYHLSQTNNSPALAAAEVSEALDLEGCGASVVVMEQDRPSEWLEVAS